MTTAAGPPRDRPVAGPQLTTRRRRIGERVVETVLAAAALFSVLVTAGIVVSLLAPLVTFFSHVDPFEFLFGTEWSAAFGNKASWDDKSWGVLPLVVATFLTTGLAMLVAVPVGLGTAMFL